MLINILSIYNLLWVFLIYHNDFFPSKITYGFAAKYYENSETSNIASLYFDIEISGKIHQYFKYKYYDI